MIAFTKLLKLIEEGEGLHTEFKLKFPEYEKIAKTAISFANTDGGNIIFGIADDKTIVGVDSEKEIEQLFNYVNENYCFPKIDFTIQNIEYKKNQREIVIVNIPLSPKRPIKIKDNIDKIIPTKSQVFIRIQDKSVLASPNMIKYIYLKANNIPLKNYKIGKYEKLAFSLLDKNEFLTLQEFKNASKLKIWDAAKILLNLARTEILKIIIDENGNEFYTYHPKYSQQENSPITPDNF